MAKKKIPFKDINIRLDSTEIIPDEERDQQVIKNNAELLEEQECHRLVSIFDNKVNLEKWKSNREGTKPLGQIEEHILFWPSAPIHALGWPRNYPILESERASWHTMRLLKRSGQKNIDRIYLFFNGLNEWRTFQTYYRLADFLFQNEERRRQRKDKKFEHATSACIIRPFPAHLTRHPYSSNFFKLPMAHYLEDAAELYRQFLRYMVETQWLLSALVPFENIPLKSGLDLLAREKREEPSQVANAILEAWQELEEADKKARKVTKMKLELVSVPVLELLTNQISRLRQELSWKLAQDGWQVQQKITEISFRPLSIHGIGYSIGGFVAQAIMFTWPQLIATGTMLGSGGSISDVQAAFVHEQEWLYVLNRIFPDLENPAISQQIPIKKKSTDRTPTKIYGLPRGYYSTFRRAFDQIILQRSIRRQEYTDWLEEFHDRLLFVLGGSDPVVKVANVIESAPPSGINAIEIAGLKHELHDREFHEWQKFWLPRIVTRTIEHFSRRREKDHYLRLRNYWDHWPTIMEVNTDVVYVSKYNKEQIKTGRRELSLTEMEEEVAAAIDWMKLIESPDIPAYKGIDTENFKEFLVVARNRVPIEFFHDSFLDRYGIVQHYSEEGIAEAEVRRRERRSKIKALDQRLRIILPFDFEEIEALDVGGPLAQWPDATGGRDWSPRDTRAICREIKSMWKDKILIWKPSKDSANTLPDCWYFFARAWMIKTEQKVEQGCNGVLQGINRTIEQVTNSKNRTMAERNSAFREWLSGV